MAETVIELKDISKIYSVALARRTLVGNLFFPKLRRNAKNEILALRDINFSVKKGEALGIIGENASGKTTILRLISSITFPSQGRVVVKGRVAGLLDLGAGFHPELTGRENIYLNAALFGLRRYQIDTILDKIIEFSGLEQFIDAQVKTYSQGMLVRLGFSVAIHVEPEILLIDDTLAVGDEEFQRKCLNKIREYKEKGKTIIIVTHDLNTISHICERGLLLKSGCLLKDAPISNIILRYVEAVGDKKAVACIDLERLSLIFNQGRLILIWDGKPITKNFGGYISLLIFDKWVMSWDAEWRILKNGKDYFEAEGIWHKIGAKVKFDIRLTNEQVLNWRVVLEIPTTTQAKKVAIGLMANEGYDHFLHEDYFEKFEIQQKDELRWHDSYRTDEEEAVLVLSSSQNMPAVAVQFTQKQYKDFRLVQITDKNLNARVLLIQVMLPEHIDFAEYKVDCSADVKLLGKSEVKLLLERQIKARSIHAGVLAVQLRNKKFHLYYQDQELTKDRCLWFGFFYENHYRDLFDGQWEISKNTGNFFVLTSEFKSMGLRIELSLELKNDILNWELGLKENSQKFDGTLFAQVFLKEIYKYYFDIDEEKKFENAMEFNEEITLKKSENYFMGLTEGNNNSFLPILVFEKGQKILLELQNASLDINARVVSFKAEKFKQISGMFRFLNSEEKKQKFLIEYRKKQLLDTILHQDNLSLDFRQDKIRVYWEDFEITAGDGLCSGVFFNGRWYESNMNTKRLLKKNGKFFVEVRRRFPPIDEEWEIELGVEEINWSVFLKPHEPIAKFYYKVGILLNPKFVQWINSYESGNFLELNNKTGVINLQENFSKLLGAEIDERTNPVILFEKVDGAKTKEPLIQNLEGNRLLQFNLEVEAKQQDNLRGQDKVFTGKIRFLKQGRLKKEIDNYCQRHFLLIPNKNFKLFVKYNAINLLYREHLLSQQEGLSVNLFSNENEFNSQQAHWQIAKNSEEEINIILSWPDLPLVQNWVLKTAEDAFIWQINFLVKQKIILTDILVNILLSCGFNRWITQNEENNFSFDFNSNNFQSADLVDNRSNFIGLCQKELSDLTPAVVFNPLANMENWCLHIHKPSKKNLVAFGTKPLVGPEGLILEEGSYDFLTSKIMLIDNKNKIIPRIDFIAEQKAAELKLGHLSLKIEKAKAKLFWREKELTKSLCLYSAFCMFQRWIDSTQGKWIIECDSNSACISLSWNKLSVRQKWWLSLNNEREIRWRIETQIEEQGIEFAIAALMVKDNYTYWQTETGRQRIFPKAFLKRQWDKIITSQRDLRVLTKNSEFPQISFNGFCQEYSYDNVIENSDALHASRVLKCQAKLQRQNSKTINLFSFEIKLQLKE